MLQPVAQTPLLLRVQNMLRHPTSLLCVVLVCCVSAGSAPAADVAIISSSDIIPYTACREGIQEQLADRSLYTATIGDDIAAGREVLDDVRRAQPKVTIAVGPQAAFVLAQEQTVGSRLFCMILNPQRLLAKTGLFPGVSLNISPDLQMRTIRQAFPDRKRIATFYSKGSNQTTVDALRSESARLGMTFVPLPITSAQEIPGLLTARDTACDVLLIIPDEQLGSTRIVEYLIKEALRRKLPVVGYNSWFAKNGAVLSFIVDYKGVGMQTGAVAQRLLEGGTVAADMILPPERVKISIDLKTAGKIGVAVSAAAVGRADEVQR